MAIGSNAMDSVRRARASGGRRAFDILLEAQSYWNNMSRFRRDRERNKRYTYGDQWCDMIVTEDGKTMSEKTWIEKNGGIAMKNNQIRKQVRTLVGLYRGQGKEPTATARDRDEQRLGETISTTLQYNMQLNKMDEMYARSFEEFCISAAVIHRKSFGWRNGKLDCWTDYVSPNNFFIDNNMRDFRGWDVSMLGEVHDVSFADLCAEFAKSAADYRRLADIYRYSHNRDYLLTYAREFGYSRPESYDFLFTSDPGRCRVIEVWRKETKPRYHCHDTLQGKLYKCETAEKVSIDAINAARTAEALAASTPEKPVVPKLIETEWFIDTYWYYYFLSPFGDILKEGETEYAHGSHPYVFKLYPYIDGEIHSFVSDIIDQQRYINRLVMLYDWILRSSAKGVLMFPEEALPEDMKMEEIADEWTRFNGIILYKAKDGVPAPAQIASNCTNIGITELLNLQLKFFEDIGVNGALQGKQGWSGMSAQLYNQQTQNATQGILDLLESFSSFVVDAAYKDVKNIQQFYKEKRMVSISGKQAVMYDPDQIKDIEFDISIAESMSTPVYRQVQNDILMKLLEMGAINVEQMLEQSSLPFADDLLQKIRSAQEQMQQSGQPQGLQLPQGLQQQTEQNANMNAVNQLYASMRGQAA